MAQLNDCRHEALVAQFGAGHVNDLLLLWLQANGATSNQINGAWHEMLIAQGIARPFQISDGWYALLGSLGYEGSMNDRETAFWCEGGGTFPTIENLYVNSELIGGALSESPDSFPPTSHALGFNQVVTSAPIDNGDGTFNWHSNVNVETGRQYLSYNLVANNPTLPIGKYRFSYDVTNTGELQGQVFVAPESIVNASVTYGNRNLGPAGSTVTVTAEIEVVGVISGGNTSRVGCGTTSTNGRSCILSNPLLVKIADIPLNVLTTDGNEPLVTDSGEYITG